MPEGVDPFLRASVRPRRGGRVRRTCDADAGGRGTSPGPDRGAAQPFQGAITSMIHTTPNRSTSLP